MNQIPEASISFDKIFRIMELARRFDVKDSVTEPDPGSNAADDMMLSVLEDHADDPVRSEVSEIIRGLNEDEQIDLVALAWLGRGDGDLDEWDDLRAEASRAHNARTAEYLLGMPILADYLEEAISQFGHSAEEGERPV